MSSETNEVLEWWTLEGFKWVRMKPKEFLATAKR
jgi:hypothetical protein